MSRWPADHSAANSLDDYFAVEASSPIRHEYANGEIFALVGASVAHNHIAAKLLTHPKTAVRGTQCSAFGSDLRLATPGGLYTYPDVMVVCGPPALVPGRPDTVTNPALLVEVLSEATRDYDRGEKLVEYQGIPTLREALLVEQDAVAVERVHRTELAASSPPSSRPTCRGRTPRRRVTSLRASVRPIEEGP